MREVVPSCAVLGRLFGAAVVVAARLVCLAGEGGVGRGAGEDGLVDE